MEDRVHEALTKGGVIDITTTGRRTGEPRRKEIIFHNVDGRLFISGTPRPRKRDWLRNLEAQPRFTFHLKGDLSADLPAPSRADQPRRLNVGRCWRR